MKKNVSVKASDGGITVEVTGKVLVENGAGLSRANVNVMADELRDRLMSALTGLRYTGFRVSKMKAK